MNKLRFNFFFFLTFFCGSLFSSTKKQLTLVQALQETLHNQWEIYISDMEIMNKKGQYQSSEGPFDPIFSFTGQYVYGSTYSSQLGVTLPAGPITIPSVGTLESVPPQGVLVNLLTTNVAAEIRKKTRFGTKLSLQAQAENNYNPLDILNSGYSNLSGYTSIGTGTLVLKIDQPLLKGFLNSKETMTEKSYEYQVEATKCSFLNEISLQLLNTTKSYWDLIKSHKLLKIYKASEKQNAIFVDDVTQLIDKNQLAKTQLSQPLKDYLSTKTTLTQVKQDIIEASQKLAYAMGAPETFMTYCNENLELEDFPVKDIYQKISCDQKLKPAIAYATAHRDDLKALGFYQLACQMQVKGAYNETLPSLDFEFEGTKTNNIYTLGKFAVFKSWDMPYPQKEFSFQLSLNFPLFRDFGKGEYKSAKAQKKQADLKYEKLQYQITTSVIQALNDHNSIINEISEIDQAIQQANIYLDQQKKLFKAGLTDLFELLQAHNNKVEQEVRKIEIETNYYKNIADIRYLMGLVIKGGICVDQIEIDEMNQLPQQLWLQLIGVK